MTMAARKMKSDARARGDQAIPVEPSRAKKKTRGPRVPLTHIEVRRGETLRLRIAVADDALADVGDELGGLLKKIAPGTRTAVVATPAPGPDADPSEAMIVTDFNISQPHSENDVTYHTILREHLTDLVSTLCDTSLAEALEIVREESARRAEGGN